MFQFAELRRWFLTGFVTNHTKSKYQKESASIWNYSKFREKYEQVCAKKPANSSALVLFVDADNLKQINDTLGHVVGDQLIAEIENTLLDSLPCDALVCRKGGDEFIACVVVDDTESAERIAEGVTCMLNTRRWILGHEILLSCSVGATISSEYKNNLSAELKQADMAMYWAKNSGKSQLKFFDNISCADLLMIQELSALFPAALERKEIIFYLQPIFHISSRKIVGAEALIRWQHPKYGMINPESIIGIASKSGRISQLGIYVLRQACRAALNWPVETFVSVNFSACDFLHPGFPDSVLRELDSLGFDKTRLKIEITEAEKLEVNETVLSTITKLRQNGVRVGIDDFGIGHSSMVSIDSYPLDFVKIDRSLISDCDSRKTSRVFIKAIHQASKNLCIEVIAEGIETLAEAAVVRGIGIPYAQGFYFNHPVTPEEMSQLFDKKADDLFIRKNLMDRNLARNSQQQCNKYDIPKIAQSEGRPQVPRKEARL
ncbi:putative bifunctional diguanylate cyclase/phosphodiesterase [Roseobacter sp.]|uniref:putative bifunctional diguanylate cyclase/phosphodiesterase n=1 Tax=Roseobacter sp. TaxID=1907202 RepID=UPI00385943E1